MPSLRIRAIATYVIFSIVDVFGDFLLQTRDILQQET